MEERVQGLEKQMLFWKRVATAQLAFMALLALLGAAQSRRDDELKRGLVLGSLGVIGEESIANALKSIAVGAEPVLPEDARGWLLNESGLSYRGSNGRLQIAEGPDGIPSITIVDAKDIPRLIIGSVSIRDAGNRGGATVRPPSSIAFVNEEGAAFQTLP